VGGGWGGVGGGGAATPTVQLNSIFSAKTNPRENPGNFLKLKICAVIHNNHALYNQNYNFIPQNHSTMGIAISYFISEWAAVKIVFLK
jgi:hypothetical protein